MSEESENKFASKVLPIRPPTRREAQIAALDTELQDLEAARIAKLEEGGRRLVGPEAEVFFRHWVASRHGHAVNRAGWPDFLLTHAVTGKVFGVEVKSENDSLSKGQARCFATLERAGIPVYVWQPHRPGMLTAWRRWFESSKGFRHEKAVRMDTRKQL